VAFALLQLGRTVFRDRHVWGFLLFFLVPCVPWIARNMVVYHTPLYDGINNHTVWLDRFDQLSDPAYALMVNWKEHTYTWNALPTMFTYLSSHSALDIGLRALNGIKAEAILLVNALTPPFAGRVMGAFLLLLALIGGWRDIRTARGSMTLLTACVFLLPYAWYYQVVSDERFIAPLIPFVILYAARALVGAFVAAGERVAAVASGGAGPTQWARGALAAGLVVTAAAALAIPLVQGGGVPEVTPVVLDDDQAELFGYLRDSAGEDDVLLIGPTARYWGYLWYANFRGRLLPTAGNHPLLLNASVAEFTTYLRSRGVTTVMVHEENVASPRSLEGYFARDSRHGLSQIQPIDGWRLVRSHSGQPVRFLVYKLD
jgi:hypothetical protein